MCVDLEKAFDTIPRDHLFANLGQLGVEDTITTLLRAWHSGTRYFVQHHQQMHGIAVGRGARL